MSNQDSFLPVDYDPSVPVAVIAGRGDYPGLSVEAMRRRGVPVRLVGFTGETRPELVEAFPEGEREVLKVGQLGRMLKALRRMEARYVLMAGQITPGRLFRDLHPDLKAIRILAMLRERNAATIFGAICREIEAVGVSILDARAFLGDSLATEGCMTGGRLRCDPDHVEHGVRIARAVAALDIGQGVVVRKGTVLAVEAFEGTDDMLGRANKYKTDQLIFVKTSKPDQDFRYDVPVFGPRTLEVMHSSGISTACLEVGNTLILQKERVLAQARTYEIQIHGYS